MVIVLLLLLSILGTAFISTSHNDRINSQQNILNVQSEANFDGLSKIIGGLFVDDLNDALGNFRGMMTSSFPPGYLGQWNAAQTYSAGNTVNDPANPANFYTCIKNTLTPGILLTNTTYWSAPFPWSNPRSTFRGVWSPLLTYGYGDTVAYEGNPAVVGGGVIPVFYYANNPTTPPVTGTAPPNPAAHGLWLLTFPSPPWDLLNPGLLIEFHPLRIRRSRSRAPPQGVP